MKSLESTNAELKAYIAGLKEEENRKKLICLVVAGAVIIALLVVGIVLIVKNKCDDDWDDEWDDDWDDDDFDEDEAEADNLSGECCCTDSDVDDSVKVKKFDK